MAQRKIPGNLSFSELRSAYSNGYVPKVKIHLQEITPEGKAGHVFRELTHWTAVTTNRTIGGKGRCTISLANTNDQHFNNKSQRIFNPAKAAVTQSYLKDLHKRTLGWIKEINPNRRGTNSRDFQGIRSFTDADINEYVNFIYNFDGFFGGQRVPQVATTQAGTKPDLPALGLIQRVIVDSQGPDGKWYADFTGIVSTVDDRVVPGDGPVVDLVCLDYWRLFDLSEMVVRTGADPIQDNLQFTLLGRLSEVTATTTTLANMSAADVLQTIMDIVQRTMCWIPYALNKNNTELPNGITGALALVPDQTFQLNIPDPTNGPKTVPVEHNDFFNDEPFWYIPLDNGSQKVPQTYEGHDSLRHYCKAAPTTVPGTTVMQDGDEPFDGMPVAQIYSTLLIDKYINQGVQATPYSTFIASLLQPWQTTRTVGSTMIRRVGEATFYDVLLTANGDVLYQIPKYNNCPGEYSKTGASSSGSGGTSSPAISTAPSAQAPLGVDSVTGNRIVPAGSLNAQSLLAANPANVPNSDFISAVSAAAASATSPDTGGQAVDPNFVDGDYDYAPEPEKFAQKSHGFNYAITNVGNRGWRLSSSEEALVTTVRVPFGPELLADGLGITNPVALTGRTQVVDTKELIARFGLRVFEAAQMSVANILSIPNNQDFMNTFALALLQQINGRTSGGSLDLSFRPDLDIGKNIFHIERQKMFYVTGISRTTRQGQDASTTLQCSYGHDISREIISPFVSVRNLNTASAASGISSSGASAPAVTMSDVNTLQADATAAQAAFTAAEARNASPEELTTLQQTFATKQLALTAAQQALATQVQFPPGASGGPAILGVTLGAPTSSFIDNAANGVIIPASYTGPIVNGLSSAINHAANGSQKLTTTSLVPSGIVINGKSIGFVNVPVATLVQQANTAIQAAYPGVTISPDEYSLARILQSEGGGTLEQVLIAQTVINTARRGKVSITRLATRSAKFAKATDGFYGNQAGKYASTAQDPTIKKLLIAQAVLRSGTQIVPGVVQFFNVAAFSSQPGVTRTAGRTAINWTAGKNGNVWIGAVEGLDSKKNSIFFRTRRASDTEASIKIMLQKLLVVTGPA